MHVLNSKRGSWRNRPSFVDSDYTLVEVIAEQLKYVIESQARQKPFISIPITKQQLFWGSKKNHFAGAGPFYESGLLRHANVRIPSNEDRANAKIRYGYDALQTPHSILNQLVNYVVRERILVETIDGGELEDVRCLRCKDYLKKNNETGKFIIDPDKPGGISCYVFFLKDNNVRDVQNQWLSGQDEWVKQHTARSQATHIPLLQEERKRHQKALKTVNKLIEMKEFEELAPGHDVSLIGWA